VCARASSSSVAVAVEFEFEFEFESSIEAPIGGRGLKSSTTNASSSSPEAPGLRRRVTTPVGTAM
jgi:hypothetical protein